MSFHNLHTYPTGLPTQVEVNIPPVSIGEDAGKDYQVFELADDIDNFEVIPTKIINRPWDNESGTIKSVVIPLVSNMTDEFNLSNFTRRLFVNQNGTWGVSSGNKMHIKINRPVVDGNPKKAYIHSIIYGAYDFNDMLPYFDSSTFGKKLDDTDLTLSDMILDNIFGTDKGLIIKKTAGVSETDPDPSGLHSRQSLMPRSANHTTAHYPVTRNLRRMERINEIMAMERLGQAGLRSSIRGGLLPSDIIKNNFKLVVGGINSATPTADNTLNYTLFATGQDKNSFNNDNIIPAYNNEIDLPIPDDVNWLSVDVAGAGWRHGIDWKQDPANVKMNNATPSTSLMTYVQMPVKVSIAIKYV